MGGSHQLQVIVTGLSVPMGLAFEAGDLYITNSNTITNNDINNTVSVFPEKSGTLFGVPVTRHVLTTVFSGLSTPMGLAFDQGGNLYVANAQNGTVSVLPKASGTLFGVAVMRPCPRRRRQSLYCQLHRSHRSERQRNNLGPPQGQRQPLREVGH